MAAVVRPERAFDADVDLGRARGRIEMELAMARGRWRDRNALILAELQCTDAAACCATLTPDHMRFEVEDAIHWLAFTYELMPAAVKTAYAEVPALVADASQALDAPARIRWCEVVLPVLARPDSAAWEEATRSAQAEITRIQAETELAGRWDRTLLTWSLAIPLREPVAVPGNLPPGTPAQEGARAAVEQYAAKCK